MTEKARTRRKKKNAGLVQFFFVFWMMTTLSDRSVDALNFKENKSLLLRRNNPQSQADVDASSAADAKADAGDFDFYVLSMSYQPEFCYQHRHSEFPGCEQPHETWKGNLTLHGLWPQYNNGSWPATCSTEKFDPQTVVDLGFDRFLKYWPNVKAPPQNHDEYYEFYQHEWTKHGTCSGLVQDDYFDTALDHYLPTPNLVGENYGQEVSASDLRDAYRKDDHNNNKNGLVINGGNEEEKDDVVLVCSGKKKSYLSEVRICVARDKRGKASERIPCIDQVTNEGNCMDTITIPKFYIEEHDKEEWDDNDGLDDDHEEEQDTTQLPIRLS